MSTTWIDSAGSIAIPDTALQRYLEESQAAGGEYDEDAEVVTAMVSFVGPCLVAELRSLVAEMRDSPASAPVTVEDIKARIAQIEARVAEVCR